ncbi:MAG: ABC transporter ATP-binding protein/permease [Bacteroidetes bacterium]|nr:ABC transporter ATP-binding protein/permease [Bacteroidota bacterium]
MTISKKIYYLLTPSERKKAMILLLLMFIGMGLEVMGIGLVIPAIGLMSEQNLVLSYPRLQPVINALGNPTQIQLIIGAMLTLVVMNLIKMIFISFLIWQQTHFTMGVQVQISQRLFTIYLRQPYIFHLSRNSAQLIRNSVSEVNQFSGALSNAISLLTDGLVTIGIVSLLLMFEPIGTIIVMLILGIATLIFYRITRSKIIRWGEIRQLYEGFRIQNLQEGLGGVKDVKILGRESDFLKQYNLNNTKTAEAGRLHQTVLALPRLWLEFIVIIALAALVIIMIIQGQNISSIIPKLGLFTASAFRLLPSINKMLTSIQSLRYALPVINILFDEFKLDAIDPNAKTGANVKVFSNEIMLRDISYTYPNTPKPTLNNLTLTIRNGESVGFIGSSGSGKSTMVDVLLGLLTPNAGQVLFDGENIQQNLRAWQNQIGYVPQHIYLTDDTLRRNVAFGLSNDQIDDSAVNKAIMAAQLGSFVESLPLGLETLVGERGVRLSGGQRQRIGIARALYHDPAVLVLDEATSSLDISTERSVMKTVTNLQGTKTILIVAHRLSTVEHCDRIFRLEEGKIVGSGSPKIMLSTTK